MEIKTREYDAVSAVHLFRDEFSESLSDSYNQIYWEIVGDPLSATYDDEMRPDRLLNLYIEILIEAETEHQGTGKKFDDCLDGLLSEAHHKSTETSLSAAWVSILKAQFHYYNGQMHLALRELIEANFCFGVYIGNYNFSFKYKSSQSKNAKGGSRKDAKCFHIKIIEYYIENKHEFEKKYGAKHKENAAYDISELDWCRLKESSIYDLIKGNVYEKLRKLRD